MTFSSIEFLFLFLPVVLAGYYVCPRKVRNLWLLVCSLLFYAWGEPTFVLIMIGSIVFNYVMALAVEASGGRRDETSGAFGGSPDQVYGGRNRGTQAFKNANAPIDRRITVIKDSFGRSVAACMVLAFREVILLDPRCLPKGVSLRAAVEKSHPDMVVEIISAGWSAVPIGHLIDASAHYKWQFFKWKNPGH